MNEEKTPGNEYMRSVYMEPPKTVVPDPKKCPRCGSEDLHKTSTTTTCLNTACRFTW